MALEWPWNGPGGWHLLAALGTDFGVDLGRSVGWSLLWRARAPGNGEPAAAMSPSRSRCATPIWAILAREVTHRSKNLLAVVVSLANQIARQSGSVEEFRGHLAARLHALGRSKDLLIAGEWKGADLAELVRTQLRPFVDPGSSRLTLEGPPLFLHADAVRNLGLALHELATNAAKYGALTVDEGTITVQWRLRGGERGTVLELSWAELAGCCTRSTERDGFGSLVLTVLVPRAVGGSAALEFTEKGLRWSLRAPLRQVMGS